VELEIRKEKLKKLVEKLELEHNFLKAAFIKKLGDLELDLSLE